METKAGLWTDRLLKAFLFGQQLTALMPSDLLTPRSRVLGNITCSQVVNQFPAFLLCLQVPATCPYTEPQQSSPCSPIPLPEDPPLPSVFFNSVSQYLSAICSICSQLYHDMRIKYTNFTTHDNTQF